MQFLDVFPSANALANFNIGLERVAQTFELYRSIIPDLEHPYDVGCDLETWLVAIDNVAKKHASQNKSMLSDIPSIPNEKHASHAPSNAPVQPIAADSSGEHLNTRGRPRRLQQYAHLSNSEYMRILRQHRRMEKAKLGAAPKAISRTITYGPNLAQLVKITPEMTTEMQENPHLLEQYQKFSDRNTAMERAIVAFEAWLHGEYLECKKLADSIGD